VNAIMRGLVLLQARRHANTLTQRPSVRVEKAEKVTTVIIDRRHARNAVDRSTADALADAFREFERDDSSCVGVLYGEHGTFCAGADLKVISNGLDSSLANRLEPTGDGPMGPSRMSLSKPVIAAIAGHAVAGGLELALWCDLRVAESDAVLGVFCRRWGVPLIDGGTVRLPRVIGLGRALDLTLTGRAVEADEALAIGLVNRVVPRGNARTAAEALARQIAAHPQLCLRSDRQSIYEQQGASEAEAMAREFELGRNALNMEAVAGSRRFAGGEGRGGQAPRPGLTP
jgi:enoyl-CoA hydratase